MATIIRERKSFYIDWTKGKKTLHVVSDVDCELKLIFDGEECRTICLQGQKRPLGEFHPTEIILFNDKMRYDKKEKK